MEIFKMLAPTTVEEILCTLNIPVNFIMPDNKILFENEQGVTIKLQKENKYWVYIKKDLPDTVKQKVLCHELGHIVLGHLTDTKFPFMPKNQREQEAENFASFILPYIYKPAFVNVSKEHFSLQKLGGVNL